MNFLEKTTFGTRVLKAIILKRKSPLAITWNITYKCNLRCLYCGAWERKTEELSTQNIFQIIDQISRMGTKLIWFSGGEPLLRDDIGEIIDYCKKKKIIVEIKSNGTLIQQNFLKIKNVSKIQISLDGNEHVHDTIRGKGVFRKVINAIDCCKTHDLKIGLTTVISKYNIAKLHEILKIAKHYKIKINFQPADQNHSGNSSKDISSNFASNTEYTNALNAIIAEKKSGNKYIQNSLMGLTYISQWPKAPKVDCCVDLIFCTIEPDGKIFICDMFPDYQKYLISAKNDFEEAFSKLSFPHMCPGCWSSKIVNINLLRKFGLKRKTH